MMRFLTVTVLMVGLAGPLRAQVSPVAGAGDPHLQFVDYGEGQVFQLRGAPGYQLMVELSPDEQVHSVALGDSAAWQVSVSKTGNRLFLKPTQADVATNMTVVTSIRVYAFDLFSMARPSAEMPYMVQFRYPTAGTDPASSEYVDVSAIRRRLSRYRISGDRHVRPASVTDDGQRTWISWPRGAPVPAVYAPGRSGAEVLLNGMMGTDDVYVVDGAPHKLIFRIDSHVARAERIASRKSR